MGQLGRNTKDLINKKKEKDNTYNMLKVDCPYLCLSLKQRMDNQQEIVFVDFSLTKIYGEIRINLGDRVKDVLVLSVDEVVWKPFDCRYPNLLPKRESKNGQPNKAVEIEVKLNKKTDPIVDFKNKILQPREFLEDHIPIIVTFISINILMVNKSLKEIIQFVESNLECLRENPLLEDYKLLDTIKKEETTLAKIKLSDSCLLLPESSQSANFLAVSFKDGAVYFQKSNEAPKIICQPAKLFIIDKKAAFNLKSIMVDEHELVPHTRIEIMASDVAMYFYIDQEVDSFMKVKKLGLTMKTPKNESIVMMLRKEIWKKKYQSNVVSYKPSLAVDIGGGEISTTMVILFFIFFILGKTIIIESIH